MLKGKYFSNQQESTSFMSTLTYFVILHRLCNSIFYIDCRVSSDSDRMIIIQSKFLTSSVGC